MATNFSFSPTFFFQYIYMAIYSINKSEIKELLLNTEIFQDKSM